MVSGDHVTTLNLVGISTVLPFGATVQNLSLHVNTATPPTYSTATIFSTGNVTNSLSEDASNSLTLGANLTLTNNLEFSSPDALRQRPRHDCRDD